MVRTIALGKTRISAIGRGLLSKMPMLQYRKATKISHKSHNAFTNVCMYICIAYEKIFLKVLLIWGVVRRFVREELLITFMKNSVELMQLKNIVLQNF